MKPSDFETNFTAWLDGQLDPAKTAEFEAEMRRQGFDPAAERAAHEATTRLFREHSPAPALPNADFFQHQLLHQIERDTREAEARPRRSWWSFPRLVWAGAMSLLVAGVLFKTMIPVGETKIEGSPYFATVVDARTYDPSISVDTVYNPRDNVTVLWLDGLDYMPNDIVTQ